MANLKFDFLHSYETGERRESEPANAYQYDEGHVLEAILPEAVTSCEIHYWIRGQEKSEAYTPGSITQNEDGSCTVTGNIPNLYFETNGELRVYIVVTDGDASITTYEGFVHICQRSMPDDYVDDDPENEATRVLIEAQEAAATATAAAETCEEVLESIPADYSQLSEDVSDLKDDLTQTKLYLVDNTDVLTLSPWVNKRVTAEGLVNSPSQLTTENVIYLGKGNILSLEAQSTTRQISISYYSINANGDMTYINSDVFRINYLKYIGVKYDFARLSFVGGSSNPPLISEFSARLKHVQYNEFLGKNISFLGDSITTYRNISETSDSVNAPYYPTGDISFPEQCYWKMFSDAVSGANLSISAISNSSYRNQGNDQCPSAYDTTRINRLSLNGTPDYVFINMGTNDPYSSNIGSEIGYTYDVETLEANVVYSSYAIQTTIRKIQTTYPNAKIILLIPKFASAINTGNYTFEKWERICDYIKEIGNMYGVYKIVDMRKCGITVDTMNSDCIGGAMHPNYTGMKKMGAYLINELIN